MLKIWYVHDFHRLVVKLQSCLWYVDVHGFTTPLALCKYCMAALSPRLYSIIPSYALWCLYLGRPPTVDSIVLSPPDDLHTVIFSLHCTSLNHNLSPVSGKSALVPAAIVSSGQEHNNRLCLCRSLHVCGGFIYCILEQLLLYKKLFKCMITSCLLFHLW